MVDWSIVTELQNRMFWESVSDYISPIWLHFIFSPVSKGWKKLFQGSVFVWWTGVHQGFCNTVSTIGRMLTLNRYKLPFISLYRKSLETSINVLITHWNEIILPQILLRNNLIFIIENLWLVLKLSNYMQSVSICFIDFEKMFLQKDIPCTVY